MRIWKALLVVLPLFFAFVSSGPAFAGDLPSPTATPTPTAIPTDEPSPTATPTPTAIRTDEPTATATPTDEPTAAPTADVEDELAFTGSNTGPATIAGIALLLAGLGFLISARRHND